jgi:hypothetical protein
MFGIKKQINVTKMCKCSFDIFIKAFSNTNNSVSLILQIPTSLSAIHF